MKKRILCYGDSDTWGQIAGTGERRAERWPVVCRRLLGADFEVLEDGVSGRTTIFDHPKSPWLNGLKGLGYALMAHRPLDAVVLFLGSNDVLYTDAEGSADGVAQLVSALVDADNFAHSKLPVFPTGEIYWSVKFPLGFTFLRLRFVTSLFSDVSSAPLASTKMTLIASFDMRCQKMSDWAVL